MNHPIKIEYIIFIAALLFALFSAGFFAGKNCKSSAAVDSTIVLERNDTGT